MHILITGGASGLGEVITRKAAALENNMVFFTYNKAKNQAELICTDFSNTEGIKCDFTNDNDVHSLLERIPAMDLDVLVNNAITGIAKKHFHKMEEKIFVNGFLHNILPTIRITQRAIQVFRKKRFGKIITILTSALINRPPVGWSEYVASKAYLLSLSKSWAVENAAFNITANCVSPAFMLTPLNHDVDQRIIENMIQSHPLKKLLTPEEVADVVLFLLQCSQQINGANIIINAALDVV